MGRFIKLFIVVSLALALPLGMKQMTRGFRLSKLRLDVPYLAEWEAVALSPRMLEEIFQQPYRYLDRGAQCYAFLSSDERFVLKLFRYDQPFNPIRRFFRSFKKPKTPLEEKVKRLFSACTLAYTSAREETGLLYLHLNPTERALPALEITTPLGQTYRLPLDAYRFAVQKKAVPLKETFLRLYTEGKGEEARECIRSLIALLKGRTAKGISNSDSALGRNFGFSDGRAVELDFGNFVFCEPYLTNPAERSQEIERFLSLLKRWFSSFVPEWSSLIEEEKKALEGM